MWQEIPPDTRLWSEADWERYFAQQESGSGDEHRVPIETPLGWEAPLPPCPDDSSTADENDMFSEDDEDGFAPDPELEELNQIPAWRAAVDFSDSVYEFVAPVCEEQQGGPVVHIMRTLCRESYDVHDYLEVGHRLGYDEDTVCGNIAICVRARRSLQRCIQCLERLDGCNYPNCARLLLRGIVARSFLDRRIADLRQMVWWR